MVGVNGNVPRAMSSTLTAAYSGRPPGSAAYFSDFENLDWSQLASVDFGLSPENEVCRSGFVERDPDILKSVLCSVLPEAYIITAALRSGFVHTPNKELLSVVCLFDSGALHTNYIGKNYLKTVRDKLSDCLKPCSGMVTLADGKTKIPVKECCLLKMSFVGNDGHVYYIEEKFMIMETAQDIIIGLPTLVTKLLPLFVEMLSNVGNQTVVDDPNSQLSELILQPWSAVDEIAPEDEETPLPCSFSEALYYLSISHADAVQEYFGLLESHVDSSFADSTDIIPFLKSDIAIKAFVPKDWTGVAGVPLVKLKFRDGMPAKMKPAARPINPKLYENARREFDRLCTYFYEPSDSPIASPLCIAYKATAPFLRFAGDYSIMVNKYIETGHYPIPNVFHSLEKISKFKVFIDADLTNSFHQLKLDPYTSRMLSVQTPWGQVQPKFLPEGVPPGSGLLQEMVMDIFGEFEDFCIIIFDNLLILANDYDDAFEKAKLVVTRAAERNLVLKMKKSWFGVPKVNFFGYECTKGSFRLSEERKAGIAAMPFPNSVSQMRRFLGCSVFFLKFMPLYSDLTAPLSEMIKTNFNWDPSSWLVDYEKAFTDFKALLLEATALHYPDYTLDWILRADASEMGVGFVLMQVFISDNEEKIHQPILFGSKKFSDQARRWSTYAQEAFAMYFSFKACEYYLRAKAFIYEGDHANLKWMEQSSESKVIRWRIYMQTLSFTFNHIPGKRNMIADWQSRFEHITHDFDAELDISVDKDNCFECADAIWNILSAVSATSDFSPNNEVRNEVSGDSTCAYNFRHPRAIVRLDPAIKTVEIPVIKPHAVTTSPEHAPVAMPTETLSISKSEMLRATHGGRAAHNGVRRTYDLLCKNFPGHGISQSEILAYREACPVCQKNDTAMSNTLVPIIRTLKNDGPRRVVGIDYLSLVLDKFGNNGAYVMRDHFTKLVFIHATATRDTTAAALAIFSYCVTYGKFDTLISDPGSELTSEGVALLNQWFGIHHRVSLVDRHESNGVEGANKQILRRLRDLSLDEQISRNQLNQAKSLLSYQSVKDVWSSPHVIGWVSYIMNSLDTSETGVSAFDLTFGTSAQKHFVFPERPLDRKSAVEYLRVLDDALQDLTKTTSAFQDRIVEKRAAVNTVQNTFQPGDFVLFELPKGVPRPNKLGGPYRGPFSVLRQYKNDVEVRHLALGKVVVLHVERLKLFRGDLDSAKALATSDADQYVIDRILGYKGDPLLRTSTEFLVRFIDGDERWVPWSKDLFDTTQYEEYCMSIKCLRPLVSPVSQVKSWLKRLRSIPIEVIAPTTPIYLDIRAFGYDWYQALPLPDLHVHSYLVEAVYGAWVKTNRSIRLECPVLQRSMVVDHVFVYMYGSYLVPTPVVHTPVNVSFISLYPSLLTSEAPVANAEDFSYLVGKEFYDENRFYTITRIDTRRDATLVAYAQEFTLRGRPTHKMDIAYHVVDAADLVRLHEVRKEGERKGSVALGAIYE